MPWSTYVEAALTRENARRRIYLFLVLTFALSAVFWVLAGRGASVPQELITLGLMWCPGIAALVTMLAFRRNVRGLGWQRGPVRYLLLSYALPVVYAGVVYGLTWLLGWGALTTERVPEGQPWPVFALTNATVLFLAGGLLPALGEEIGWRGLLVPQLARLTSFTKTALISGAIWAVWHYPMILFAGYHGDTPRWYALLCFTVMAVAMSFAFAWLRLRSGSLWTAVILHAAHNVFIQTIFDPLTRDTGFTAYITTEFGIGLAVAAVVVAVLCWSRRGDVDGSASPVAPAT
jgi:membrane protease YdiL (CAAX protease family)